jgi:hypothetical protein
MLTWVRAAIPLAAVFLGVLVRFITDPLNLSVGIIQALAEHVLLSGRIADPLSVLLDYRVKVSTGILVFCTGVQVFCR